jgi:hypothetical protein
MVLTVPIDDTTMVLDFNEIFLTNPLRFNPNLISIDGDNSLIQSIIGLDSLPPTLYTLRLFNFPNLDNFPVLKFPSNSIGAPIIAELTVGIYKCHLRYTDNLVHTSTTHIRFEDSIVDHLSIWSTIQRLTLENTTVREIDHMVERPNKYLREPLFAEFNAISCSLPFLLSFNRYYRFGNRTTCSMYALTLMVIQIRDLTRLIKSTSVFPLIRNITHHSVGNALIPEYLSRPDPVADPYVMTEIDHPVVTAMFLGSNVSRRALEFVSNVTHHP